MKPATFLSSIVRPGLTFMADTLGSSRIATPEAELLLLAIALQESNCKHRRQEPTGPARGFWQFERGGGYRGVREHARSGPMLKQLVAELHLPDDEEAQWAALPESELLQVCFARLLLWTDNAPLPGIGDKEQGWAVYMRNWRPGKPHRDRWDVAYQAAFDLTRAGSVPRAGDRALRGILDQIEQLFRVLRSEIA